MACTIGEDRMTCDAVPGTVATRIGDGLWTVTGRHGVYTRDQAIKAMMIAELRSRTHPHPNDAVCIAAFEQQLLVPPMPRDAWALLQTLKAAAAAVRGLPDSEEFDDEPFGGDIAECLLRIGDAVVDLGAAVDALADRAAERSRDDDQPHEWHRVEGRANNAVYRLRDAGGDLHAGGLAAEAAERMRAGA